MAIEEIRYDFTEHGEHFRNFFSKILKLIIISKLNCQQSNKTSVKYFNEIVNNIENCKTHQVKYGKSMIFIKFLQCEFTYQTIKVILKSIDKNLIDIRIESILTDILKFFDELSSDTKTIRWNVTNTSYDGFHENRILKKETSNTDSNEKSNYIEKNEIKNIFNSLEAFIEALYHLSSIPPDINKDSLIGKLIEIKDVSVIRKNLTIEMLIDEKIIIINISSKKSNPISIVIDDNNNTGKTIKELILQNRNF